MAGGDARLQRADEHEGVQLPIVVAGRDPASDGDSSLRARRCGGRYCEQLLEFVDARLDAQQLVDGQVSFSVVGQPAFARLTQPLAACRLVLVAQPLQLVLEPDTPSLG